ncbi:REP-associated tyrosine transposase [Reichenbachiella sp.]
MSEKYKFLDPEGLYFTTSTVVHWIDLFTRAEFKHVIVASLKFCQEKKGLKVHAWVLMPSHLHMIVSAENANLSEIFRDFKKHTAGALIKEIKRINESRKEWLLRAFKKSGKPLNRISEYKVWQDGNHPILLDSAKWVQEKLDYIHHNPVQSEIVDEPEYYWYSSARNYAGHVGMLKIEMLS